MFKILHYEAWHHWVPVIALAVFFLFFMGMLVRTLLMKREKADRSAHLPMWEDEAAPNPIPSPTQTIPHQHE